MRGGRQDKDMQGQPSPLIQIASKTTQKDTGTQVSLNNNVFIK